MIRTVGWCTQSTTLDQYQRVPTCPSLTITDGLSTFTFMSFKQYITPSPSIKIKSLGHPSCLKFSQNNLEWMINYKPVACGLKREALINGVPIGTCLVMHQPISITHFASWEERKRWGEKKLLQQIPFYKQHITSCTLKWLLWLITAGRASPWGPLELRLEDTKGNAHLTEKPRGLGQTQNRAKIDKSHKHTHTHTLYSLWSSLTKGGKSF